MLAYSVRGEVLSRGFSEGLLVFCSLSIREKQEQARNNIQTRPREGLWTPSLARRVPTVLCVPRWNMFTPSLLRAASRGGRRGLSAALASTSPRAEYGLGTGGGSMIRDDGDCGSSPTRHSHLAPWTSPPGAVPSSHRFASTKFGAKPARNRARTEGPNPKSKGQSVSAQQSSKSTLIPLKDAMAELVQKVHPDLFASGPAGAGETNDESLKAIQTVLDSVTRDKTTPNAGIKRLKFFVMDDESPQGVRVVPFSFKTTGGDCRNLVAKQLKDVMAKVGTSSDFRWDPGDWEVRADAGYVARSQNPWSNVKGTSYDDETGEDGSIETNRRRRGDLVAALKIADGLFKAIAAVPWIPEPQGDDRVRVINAEIVPRLAKEGWALDKDRVERIWRGERDDASVMDGLDAASGLALQAIVKHARAFDRAYGKPARERADFYPK